MAFYLRFMIIPIFIASTSMLAYSVGVTAEERRSPENEKKNSTSMTNKAMDEIIRRIAKDIEGGQGFWRFHIQNKQIIVITDDKADRMRIMTPIIEAEKLDSAQLLRLMQANFDSALDARYSIAKNVLWGTFLHPFQSLGDREFLSGLGQVVNLANTYGSTYSSGAIIFRGGDSDSLRERELIDDLINKGLAI